MLAANNKSTVKFLRILSHLLENDLLPSQNAKDLFRCARGVPIPKKKPGEIRPLAVGEALRRISCKIIKHAIGNDRIASACGPLQFGAGVSCGTELAAGIPRLALSTMPGFVSVGLDCSNAFQNVDRQRTLAKVRKYLPQAFNLARSLYEGDSFLILSHEEKRPDDPTIIESTQGVHQGCVFGSIYFCIAIRDALADLAEELRKINSKNGLSAYCDDIELHVDSCDVSLAIRLAIFHLAKENLTINAEKTEIYAPSEQPDASGRLLAPHPPQRRQVEGLVKLIPSLAEAIPPTSADDLKGLDRISAKSPGELDVFVRESVKALWNESDGKTYVGAPHGSPEYVAKSIWKKAVKAVRAAEIAEDYSYCASSNSRQEGYHLLRLCVYPKLHHLARMLPLLFTKESGKRDSNLDGQEVQAMK